MGEGLGEKSLADVHWVNSHKSAEFFEQKGWPQSRRLINEDIDGVCRDRFGDISTSRQKQWRKGVDSLVQEVCYHLGRKANFILQHRKDPDFPWSLRVAELPEGDVCPTPTVRVVPNPAFTKNHTPSEKQQMLCRLSGAEDSLGHRWVEGSEGATNITMKCEVCGLYVQQISDQASFRRLMNGDFLWAALASNWPEPCWRTGPVFPLLDC